MTQQLFDDGYKAGRNADDDLDDFSNLDPTFKAGWLVGRGEALAVVGGSPSMHVSHLLIQAHAFPEHFKPYVTPQALAEWSAEIREAREAGDD